MTDRAFAGLDSDEPEIAAPGEAARVPAILRRRNVVPSEQGDADIADLHRSVSSQRAAGHHRIKQRLAAGIT